MKVYSRGLIGGRLAATAASSRRSWRFGSTTTVRRGWLLFRGWLCRHATSCLSRGRKHHHTFHLALEALGLGATASAVQAQDLLVVVFERDEQFLAEYSRLSLLELLQHHHLIAECSCVAGVGMIHSDGVANETVYVRYRLGGHVGGWLVVGRFEGGERTLQQRVNGSVLAWGDLQTLHGLATGENMEKVSQQLVVGNKLDIFSECRGKYWSLPINNRNVLCVRRNKSVYTSMYVLSMHRHKRKM